MSDAYALFAMLASLCSLWAMQKTTSDATLSTWMGKVKWCHRGAIALASIVFMASAAESLYHETQPRWIDFFLICVLLAVLVLSVMRHMQVPIRREQGQFSRLHYGDQSRQ